MSKEEENRVEDIHGAVDFIVNYKGVDRERVGILGICGGGGYTLRAAQTDKRIRAVATLSAFNTGIVRKNGFLDSQMDTMTPEETEKMPFDLYKDGYVYYGITHRHTGSSFAYTVSSNIDLFAFDARSGMEMIDQPLLMMAGKSADTLYMTEGCFERATGTKNKELFLIDGATHIKTYWYPEYVEKITDKLEKFYGRYL